TGRALPARQNLHPPQAASGESCKANVGTPLRRDRRDLRIRRTTVRIRSKRVINLVLPGEARQNFWRQNVNRRTAIDRLRTRRARRKEIVAIALRPRIGVEQQRVRCNRNLIPLAFTVRLDREPEHRKAIADLLPVWSNLAWHHFSSPIPRGQSFFGDV